MISGVFTALVFAWVSIRYDAPQLAEGHVLFSMYCVSMFVIHQLLLRASGLDIFWRLFHATLMFCLIVFMHTIYWRWWDFLLTAHTARSGLHHLINFIKSPLPLFIFYIVFLLSRETHTIRSMH
jgi:hypothetical protein